jgi:hypothetical protein
VVGEMDVLSVPRLEAPFMAAPRSDKSVQSQCCPTGVVPQGFSSTASHRLMTHHPCGWFIPTTLSVRVVLGDRMGLVRTGQGGYSARTSSYWLVRAECGAEKRRTPTPGIPGRGTGRGAGVVFRRVSPAAGRESPDG